MKKKEHREYLHVNTSKTSLISIIWSHLIHVSWRVKVSLFRQFFFHRSSRINLREGYKFSLNLIVIPLFLVVYVTLNTSLPSEGALFQGAFDAILSPRFLYHPNDKILNLPAEGLKTRKGGNLIESRKNKLQCYRKKDRGWKKCLDFFVAPLLDFFFKNPYHSFVVRISPFLCDLYGKMKDFPFWSKKKEGGKESF